MTLDRISTEPFDTATDAPLGRITLAETSGHLLGCHRDDLRTYPDTTFDVRKIACNPGKPENIYRLTCRNEMPVGYARIMYPSTLPEELDCDAPQPRKIYVLCEFLGDVISRVLVTPLLLAASRLRPLFWLEVLWQNVRAIGLCTTFGFIAIGDGTYTIGARRSIFRLMARPLP